MRDQVVGGVLKVTTREGAVLSGSSKKQRQGNLPAVSMNDPWTTPVTRLVPSPSVIRETSSSNK